MVRGKKIPPNIRILLLSLPKRVVKKYTPPVYNPSKIDSGVRSSAIKGVQNDTSLRINMLAQPNPRIKREKYVFVRDDIGNGITASALENQANSGGEALPEPPEQYIYIF